jgi:hypothetical protein
MNGAVLLYLVLALAAALWTVRDMRQIRRGM